MIKEVLLFTSPPIIIRRGGLRVYSKFRPNTISREATFSKETCRQKRFIQMRIVFSCRVLEAAEEDDDYRSFMSFASLEPNNGMRAP